MRLVTAQIETKEIDATLAERTAQVERLASRIRDLEALLTEKEHALSDLTTRSTEAIDAERIASEQIAELEAQSESGIAPRSRF